MKVNNITWSVALILALILFVFSQNVHSSGEFTQNVTTVPTTVQEVNCEEQTFNGLHPYKCMPYSGTELSNGQDHPNYPGCKLSSHDVWGTNLVKYNCPSGQHCFYQLTSDLSSTTNACEFTQNVTTVPTTIENVTTVPTTSYQTTTTASGPVKVETLDPISVNSNSAVLGGDILSTGSYSDCKGGIQYNNGNWSGISYEVDNETTPLHTGDTYTVHITGLRSDTYYEYKSVTLCPFNSPTYIDFTSSIKNFTTPPK